MSSSIKTNLKFVIGSKGINKSSNKNVGASNTDFTSTININTNSKIKEKYISKKLAESKSKASEKRIEMAGNPIGSTSNNISITPNFIKKMEKIDSLIHNVNSINMMKTHDYKASSRENVKDNNYNSNGSNSNRSNNTPSSVVMKPRHQKNLSEIPSFSLRNNITEGGCTHISSSNLFEMYNQTTSAFNKEKDRERMEKQSLDPKIVKIKTSGFLKPKEREENRSSSGVLSNRLKEASVNSVHSRKMNTTGDEVENTEESHCNTNTSHHIPIPKSKEKERDKDKYAALVLKYREQEKQQKELIRTIEIMKNYIQSTQLVTDKMKTEIADRFNKKSLEIKHLHEENRAVIKANKELKLHLLKVLHQIKLFENKESTRESDLNKLFSQVLHENQYLRYSNERVFGTFTQKTEIYSANEAASNCHLNSNSNMNDADINSKQKGFHKRQKTHINFNLQNLTINTLALSEADALIQTSNASNGMNTSVQDLNASTLSNISTNTIVNQEDEDVFNSTLKSMNSIQHTKAVHSGGSYHDNSNMMSPKTNDPLNSNQKNQKHVYLFYRTPSNKEHKKIEFSK